MQLPGDRLNKQASGGGGFSLPAGVRQASYQPLNIRNDTSIPLEFSGLQPQPNDAIDTFDSEPCEFELSHAIHILQSSAPKLREGLCNLHKRPRQLF